MSNKYREIQIICKECKGSKVKTVGTPENPEIPAPCMDCDETGYIPWGRIKFKPGDFTDV